MDRVTYTPDIKQSKQSITLWVISLQDSLLVYHIVLCIVRNNIRSYTSSKVVVFTVHHIMCIFSMALASCLSCTVNPFNFASKKFRVFIGKVDSRPFNFTIFYTPIHLISRLATPCHFPDCYIDPLRS